MNHSDTAGFAAALCQFLDSSPTPFHAVATMRDMLESAGFKQLVEADSWQLQPGEKYFVARNDSSIIAWTQPTAALHDVGFRMLGAHTDSPCLKVKPSADIHRHHCWQLGVEVYGGALLNPWFDRDLSLAGRVHYERKNGELATGLVNIERPVAYIPSLAIHLDREANKNRSVNPQTQLPVLLASGGDVDDKPALADMLLKSLREADSEAAMVLDHELFLYDTQPAAIIGVEQDFIVSARLDNLLSCFVATRALLDAAGDACSLMVCTDHEEVGSQSAAGAGGPFLQQVLQRIVPDSDDYVRALAVSQLISVDNAHGLHPNYADKMDDNHGPQLNAGPVIKVNANQRYVSNSETQSIFRRLCAKADVPVQSFVVRSDMGCGSTIGPITASEIGVKTLDIGLASYAMHSIREMAGSRDPQLLKQVLDLFYSS